MLQIFIPFLSTAAGAWVAWFFTRKKSAAETRKTIAETKGIELENFEEAITLWKNIALDLRSEVKTLTEKCQALTLEVENFRLENGILKQEIQKLERSIEEKF